MNAAEIRLSTTADLSLEEIARAMNLIWSKVEYASDAPPEEESAASYSKWCRPNNIDLAQSIAARDGSGQVVGLAMLAIRGHRGWCGDFGVVPEWRGKGVSHLLMAAFIDKARLLGLHSLQLDVRAENTPARKIYEHAGFRARRTVIGLVAKHPDLHLTAADPATTVNSVPPDLASLSRWYGEPFSPPPLWQRELPSLLALEGTKSWIVTKSGQELGFLFYAPAIDQDRGIILHLGLSTHAEVEDLSALLAYLLHQDQSAAKIFAGPIAEGWRRAEWLQALGFRIRSRYLEMLLEL